MNSNEQLLETVKQQLGKLLWYKKYIIENKLLSSWYPVMITNVDKIKESKSVMIAFFFNGKKQKATINNVNQFKTYFKENNIQYEKIKRIAK